MRKAKTKMKKVIKLSIIIVILLVISVIIVKVIKIKDNRSIICIDAGHGGTDVGASNKQRYEKDDTLKVAKLVKQCLEDQDIKVVMTRNNDATLFLQDRCKIANKRKADLFISIHRNSAETGNGIEIWTNSKEEKEDVDLATNILNNLDRTEIHYNRGIKHGTIKGENTDYYVLNNTKMPSCLIELGFISDDQDNKLFDKNIKNYARSIADGIMESIKNK